MNRTIASRLIRALATLAAIAMLNGCLPGQFPIPPDRSSPPKASKKGVSSSSAYFHGGQTPLVIADATD